MNVDFLFEDIKKSAILLFMSLIVPMQYEHAARVAELHCAALSGDFLPSLGKSFLTVFYQGVLDLGVGFGFVVIEEDQPMGFILGTLDTNVLFRRVMLGRAWSLGWRLLPAIIRRPGLIVNVLETFLYPRKEGKIPEKAELVVVGLDTAYRGWGLGRQLVEALNGTFCVQGVRSYKVTVLASNKGANSFYQALRFQLALEFELYRKNWNLYTLRI